MFSFQFIFLLDRRLALFIFILRACKAAIIRAQQKGGQTTMIMFQRQIETVGSHQALISTVADRVKRRCSRIRFHRWQGCVSRQRGARLQTNAASEGHTKCTVHSETMRSWEAEGTQTDIMKLFISTHWFRLHHADHWSPSTNSSNCLVITSTYSPFYLLCHEQKTELKSKASHLIRAC